MKFKITPKFDVNQIMIETINKFWFEFQARSFAMGQILANYMRNYIGRNSKRESSTGNLAGAINFDKKTGMGENWWGIGHIPTLQSKAPYWYVVNYGKKITGEPFIPGGGKVRPIEFTDGNANPAKRGTGKARVTRLKGITGAGEPIPSIIRPMSYIEATKHRLDRRLRALLMALKRRG